MAGSSEERNDPPPKKATGPFGLSKRTHAIIFVISIIIEIALVALFGVSLWQGAKSAWAWLTGG